MEINSQVAIDVVDFRGRACTLASIPGPKSPAKQHKNWQIRLYYVQ
jgi:hypothetical protein